MATFSFANLNLSAVTAATGGSVLQPGRYLVKVREAEVSDNKNKNGKILKVKLVCNQGVITDNINVFHESEQAEKIGLEQLKSLLVNSGHPSPDNPGDISSLRGLEVGIIVAQDGEYNGQPQYKVKGYMKPENVGTPTGTTSVPAVAPKAIGSGGLPF
jgi:hypothetical protein